jgi:hypothetical protein
MTFSLKGFTRIKGVKICEALKRALTLYEKEKDGHPIR